MWNPALTEMALGLSPHMRGNHLVAARGGRRLGSIPAHAGEPPVPDGVTALLGSIPAHAGEPFSRRFFCMTLWVYPRTCGGTSRGIRDHLWTWGLSPHMRGNHRRKCTLADDFGSIPAHAGEPLHRLTREGGRRVYPRTCGGTSRGIRDHLWTWGLSPHMRGNLYVLSHFPEAKGSIPAHAGEPAAISKAIISPKVYPRTCGGTHRRGPRARHRRGLSPHMRGNLRLAGSLEQETGSIPAHAGEPVWAAHPLGSLGSIPAHAGEPARRRGPRPADGVYPRTCGGTRTRITARRRQRGLSPHMRGNPRLTRSIGDFSRSIPAHAGEP